MYAEGPWGEVLGIHDDSGVAPASDYLTSLGRAGTKFRVVAEMLATTGRISNAQRFHQVQHKGEPTVWEIKVHDGPGHRFYCIQRGRTWIVTHGGKKPSNNKLYSAEVARCRQAVKDWDAR